MWAFDLIELDGEDVRRDPLAVRKATLASLLAARGAGLRFNEHLDQEDGPLVFAHACKLGLEGIVSKRKDSRYRSGRSPHWIKSKNPSAPAVKREAEEDWSGRRWPWQGLRQYLLRVKLSSRVDSFEGRLFRRNAGRFHFTQLATPVHVHLVPSCTQSHFTGPILFNPRIMQRLMTFSMDCAHASPRLLAEAVAVVACPS